MSTLPPDPDAYLFGTGDDELRRLGLQHALWRAEAHDAWLRAGFSPGWKVLDLGCGPGWALFDLALLVGEAGHVTGVDASARFVAHVRAEARLRGIAHVSAEEGDAERLALPTAAFDGAYCRWMLTYLRDPGAAVRAVADSLRPGGRFVVQDYVHYDGVVVAPPEPAIARLFSAVTEAWRARGGDPSVGARLPAMFEAAGLRVTEVRPLVRVARPGDPLWAWPSSFFDNYVPVLVQDGFLSREEAEAFRARWAERAADPAAFFLTPPIVEVIGEKA